MDTDASIRSRKVTPSANKSSYARYVRLSINYFQLLFFYSYNSYFLQPEETVDFTSSSSDEGDWQITENPVLEFDPNETGPSEAGPSEAGPSEPKRKRNQKHVIAPKLVETLGKCKVSDRDIVRVITATVQASDHDITDLIIN